MPVTAISPRSAELSPTLQSLEEVLLLCNAPRDLDTALQDAVAHDHIPDDLRRDIESLFWYRFHYNAQIDALPESIHRQIRHNDGDWTMHLVQRIRSLAHARAPYSESDFKKKA